MSTDREEEEDCDWETDDEGDEAADQLVLVELIGTFTDDLVRDPDLRLKFVGLDTARPMVQLGNQGIDSTGDEFRPDRVPLLILRKYEQAGYLLFLKVDQVNLPRGGV